MKTEVNEKKLEEELLKRFPGENIKVVSAKLNESGTYKAKADLFNKLVGISNVISELPEYIDVRVEWCTGEFVEKIIVWSPIKWNGRFAGTAGGGTGIGGEGYLTKPDEYSRGWTVPYAVKRGYTAATADAGNGKGIRDFVLDPATGKIRHELYENWRARTTHHMTVAGKAIAEILHDRPVEYSYMNGGSGGGRQSLTEAQEYPEDYDGIWASCPAINWNKFILGGLWPNAVMNSYNHIIKNEKIDFFMEAARKAAGGRDSYFTSIKKPVFDAFSLVGKSVKGDKIIEKDAEVMQAIWNGSADKNGNFLWYGFRPGVKFWSIGNPIAVFHYSFIRKKPKTLILSTYFARWIKENPKARFENITIDDFEEIFKVSTTKMSDAASDKADLTAFSERGGKLMIDHGLNDPFIPVDSNIDYYNRMIGAMGQKTVDDFCRFYLTPGDGHGNCWDEEPGIILGSGIDALVDWVEKGIKPDGLEGAKVDKKTRQVLKTKTIYPVRDIKEWM